MNIRRATINDARRISYLVQKNADHVLENKYTPGQLAAWKNNNTQHAIKQKIEQRTIFCAFENDKMVGTIGLEDNYLVGLYISYSQRGKGLGHRLLVFLEDYARRNGIEELHLTATPNGYGFYLKYGYMPQGKVDLYYDGIKFIETKMKKKLR